MAIELVLLTPVLVGFLLLVVASGRYVAVRGQVEAASRDAARAASLERGSGAARAAAQQIATAALAGTGSCSAPRLSGTLRQGGIVTVELSCRVSYSGLGLIGLPGTAVLTASSSSPVDTFRRSEA